MASEEWVARIDGENQCPQAFLNLRRGVTFSFLSCLFRSQQSCTEVAQGLDGVNRCHSGCRSTNAFVCPTRLFFLLERSFQFTEMLLEVPEVDVGRRLDGDGDELMRAVQEIKMSKR
ncbi:hypothetical protein KC322_g8 [Hortaea werneckii]|nr:hypothetical protein KC322_g8 [Hortaea werneckii]